MKIRPLRFSVEYEDEMYRLYVDTQELPISVLHPGDSLRVTWNWDPPPTSDSFRDDPIVDTEI